MTSTATPAAAPARTPPSIVAGIIAVSAVASLFLAWLVYFHAPTDVAGTHLTFLPALNAVLNTCCTLALLAGLRLILKRRVLAHRNAMFTAFLFSTLFLVSYITNHALHGDMRFAGQGHVLRSTYFALLISHIALSVVALPMILVTFFLSAHRPLSRAPAARPLDVSHMAVRLGHRSDCLRLARGLPLSLHSPLTTMQPDTRALLRTGASIFATGVAAALSISFFFGGIGRQGPHTNSGWLALVLAMGCLPTGTLTLALALIKIVGERRR